MKAYYKDGKCYLNDKEMPESEVWDILRAEKIKQIRAQNA